MAQYGKIKNRRKEAVNIDLTAVAIDLTDKRRRGNVKSGADERQLDCLVIYPAFLQFQNNLSDFHAIDSQK